MYKAAAIAGVALAAGVVAFLLIAPLAEDAHTTADLDPTLLQPETRGKDDPVGRSTPGARVAGGVAKKNNKEKPHESADDKLALSAQADPSDKTEMSAEQLSDLLGSTDPYQAAAGAMSRLLELWTGRPLLADELGSGSLDLQLFGARRGLRYLSAELTTEQLRALDLPAVVELRPDDENAPRYVLVEAIDKKDVALYSVSPVRATRRAVEELWTGDVHILWRDTERLSRPMSKGASGPSVEKLQQMLAEAGYLKAPPSGQYDGATQDAVRRLQAARGLQETGDATTLTQIILYNALPKYERPKLVGTGDSKLAKTVS